MKILSDKRWHDVADSGEPVEAGLRKQFTCDEIKSVDDESKTIRFVISTKAVDRMGDTVNTKGWQLENFKNNPVILFAHDNSSPPVAKATDIYEKGGNLIAEAQFMPPEMSAFSHSIYQMYKEGFMRATSVGFQPLEWKFVEEDDRFGVDFLKQELLEFSTVPVPANPEALMQAKSIGVDMQPIRDWAESVLDSWDEHKGIIIPKTHLKTLIKASKDDIYQVPKELQDRLLEKNLKSIKEQVKSKEIPITLDGDKVVNDVVVAFKEQFDHIESVINDITGELDGQVQELKQKVSVMTKETDVEKDVDKAADEGKDNEVKEVTFEGLGKDLTKALDDILAFMDSASEDQVKDFAKSRSGRRTLRTLEIAIDEASEAVKSFTGKESENKATEKTTDVEKTVDKTESSDKVEVKTVESKEDLLEKVKPLLGDVIKNTIVDVINEQRGVLKDDEDK